MKSATFILVFTVICGLPARVWGQSPYCQPKKFAEFLQTAQLPDPQPALSTQNFTQCSDISIKEQASFWFAFQQSLQQLQNISEPKSAAKPTIFKPASTSSAKQKILQAARRGRPQLLKQKIAESHPDYNDDASAQLTLARSLAIKGDFKESQNSYQDYLKKQPDDGAADAEYLFTFIWAKDFEGARARINRLKTFELSSYLDGVIKRAETTLNHLADHKAPDEDEFVYLPGTFKAHIERYTQEDDSQRDSLRFAYRNIGYGSIGIHDLNSSLDPGTERVVDFQFGADVDFNDYFGMKTELGFYSLGNDNAFGELSMRFDTNSFHLTGGIGREPLTLVRMVPESGQDVMRNFAFAHFILKPFLEIKAKLVQDGLFTPFEQYEAALVLPAFAKNNGDESLTLRLPVRYEGHPKPSPFYPTAPRSLAAGIGIRYHQILRKAYEIHTEAEYLLDNRNSRSNQDSFQRLGFYRIKLDLIYKIRKSLGISLSGYFEEREKEQYERTDHRVFQILAGLNYAPTDQ